MYLGMIIQRFSKILVLDFLSSVLLIILQTVHRLYTNSWCTIYFLKKKKKGGSGRKASSNLEVISCHSNKPPVFSTQGWG